VERVRYASADAARHRLGGVWGGRDLSGAVSGARGRSRAAIAVRSARAAPWDGREPYARVPLPLHVVCSERAARDRALGSPRARWDRLHSGARRRGAIVRRGTGRAVRTARGGGEAERRERGPSLAAGSRGATLLRTNDPATIDPRGIGTTLRRVVLEDAR